MNSNASKSDDLTVIKGIGPARQRWLRESFNVGTFRDLAALSVDEIESRLKDEKQIVARNEIEAWIVQAQELALTAAQPSPQDLVPAAVNAEEDDTVSTGRSEWKPIASFVVEFQARVVESRAEEYLTRVHHVETDIDATWPGIESKALCQWMLEQMGEKALPKKSEERRAEEPLAGLPPTPGAPVRVDVTQIRLFQPPDAATPTGISQADQPFPGFIKSSQPLALEASLALGELAGVDLTKGVVTYLAQFYARDLSTGVRIHLGDSMPGRLAEEKLDYTAMLPEATLSPGVYRLQVLATLQEVPAVPGLLDVPLLQVV